MLRSVARGTGITLVAPTPAADARRRFFDAADVRLVELRTAIKTSNRLLVLDTSSAEPVSPFVPRLTICLATRKVLVDGTPQHVPGQPFRFLAMLVEAIERGGGVTKACIESAFSQRAPSDIARDLKERLSAGRSEANVIRAWIIAEGNPAEYRLTLPRASVEVTR